jgi:hypothetical protein
MIGHFKKYTFLTGVDTRIYLGIAVYLALSAFMMLFSPLLAGTLFTTICWCAVTFLVCNTASAYQNFSYGEEEDSEFWLSLAILNGVFVALALFATAAATHLLCSAYIAVLLG